MSEVKLTLSIPEAARAVSLSPWTIRKKIKQGEITPTKFGRRVTIELAELERIVKAGQSGQSVRSAGTAEPETEPDDRDPENTSGAEDQSRSHARAEKAEDVQREQRPKHNSAGEL
jgi:excisionase family DNA binding protein